MALPLFNAALRTGRVGLGKEIRKRGKLKFPVEQIAQKVEAACELYHRLVLLVGPAESGKTKILQEVCAETSAPLFNVNLELSRRMLDLTERQRILQVHRLLLRFFWGRRGATPRERPEGQKNKNLQQKLSV